MNMKKMVLPALFIFILCGCSNSTNELVVTEEKPTRIDNAQFTESTHVFTNSPLVTLTNEPTIKPEEIVIDCVTVSPEQKSVIKLIEMYTERYPNVIINLISESDTNSIYMCANGDCDLALITRDLTDDENFVMEFNFSSLYRAGIAVIVNKNNPVSNLSSNQIRDIFEKSIVDWSELGGEKGEIYKYSVDDIIMGKLLRLFNIDRRTVEYEYIPHMFVERPKRAVNEYQNGITGISVGNITGEPEVKVVGIDGIVPTYDNVKSGEYPYYIDAKFITKSDVNEEAKKFIEFCTTDPEAIEYLKSEGYVIP